MIEPKFFYEDNNHDDWIRAMNEELDQIEKNNTWELVPRPEDKNLIRSKWVFKNKIMKKDKLLEIKPEWSVKGMHKSKVGILMKPFH
jgi:hypothetical protein